MNVSDRIRKAALRRPPKEQFVASWLPGEWAPFHAVMDCLKGSDAQDFYRSSKTDQAQFLLFVAEALEKA